MSRTVAWFSCGAASAVAAKLALRDYDNVEVVYCDTSADEHPDNLRFLGDVEQWLGVTVTRIRSDRYEDVDDVIDRRRYMAGVQGALCTVELKKMPRYAFEDPTDTHIFGYTADEAARAALFTENNPGMATAWPLIDYGYTKQACLEVVREAGIKLPAMYGLGYSNNNCLGCVKATSARYWNMVRRDFPHVFAKRAEQSRHLGVKLTRHRGKRILLDDLPADYLPADEPAEDLSCGPVCGVQLPLMQVETL